MHPRFLEYLCCPKTREPLELRSFETNAHGMVDRGELVNRQGESFPIIQGIPRFVSAELYSNTFGFEWTRWPRLQFDEENVGRRMQGWTTKMWERIAPVETRNIADRVIVEFGCGPGRFLDVVRRKGGVAVGIDLSNAVVAARKNFAEDPNVLIVQGDILRPPFRENAFDGGYSIGVLHHTPDPGAGLQSLVRTVKTGGWVACCVYPKDELYDFKSVKRARSLHGRLSGRWGYRPALAYSYFSAYGLIPIFRLGKRMPVMRQFCRWLERNWIVVVDLPDRRWRVLDTFDAITPHYASTHSTSEVLQWMNRSGCVQVQLAPWCSTAVCGIRG